MNACTLSAAAPPPAPPPARLPARLESRSPCPLAHARRDAGRQLAAAFQPVVPFLAQAGASMVAYTVGLAGAQASPGPHELMCGRLRLCVGV